MSAVMKNEQADSEREDAQRMLADAVDTFVTRGTTVKRVRELRDTQPGFDRNLWQSIADQGWLGIHVPEQYGGQGLGFAELRIVAQALGGALIPEPLTACAVLATGAILHGDNEALKQKLLPQMVEGKLIVGLAWQESLSSLDLSASLKATKSAGGYTLNGTKRFVTPAAGADGYVVSANEGGKTLLVYLPASTAGVEVKLERRVDGTPCGLITFKDAKVAADAVVASAAAGEAALKRAIDEATVVASAELSGVMSNVLELTLTYMKTRVQFGVPIGSFQALQHRTTDLYIQKELSCALVAHVMREMDRGVSAERLAELASRAKARCSEAGIDLGRECIRLHGAIGFTDEYDAGLYLKRALVLSAWMGNATEHRKRFDAARATHKDLDAEAAARLKQIKPADLPGAPGERPADTDWNTLTDDQFRVEAAAFFEKHFPKHLRFAQRRIKKVEGYDYLKTASKYGWFAPAWPRRWGGMELSPAKQVILLEERERVGAVTVLDMGVVMLGPLLMKFGNEEQQREYLPKIIAAEHIWCQGYSEPNSGSDLASLQTTAVQDGDEWVINGSKIWTSGATEANHIFMLARTNKDVKRQAGISFFLIDMKTPGLTVRPIQTINGETPFCQTFFDNVRVPAKNMVGQLNQGWTVAKGLLGFERLNSGTPRRPQFPLNKTRQMAQQRGLWDDADFRARYTRLEMDVHDLGIIFGLYAGIVASGANPGPDISMLKIWSSETTMRLNALMVEAAGGAGALADDLDFGNNVKADVFGGYCMMFPGLIASGTNDIQRNVLSKRVLGLPG